MRNPQTETAWAAGLFEGAGTIVRHGSALRLSLKTTDRDVADAFARITRSNLLGPYRDDRAGGRPRQPTYVVHLNGERAEWWLRRFWPWLQGRRRAKALELGFDPGPEADPSAGGRGDVGAPERASTLTINRFSSDGGD